MAAIVVGGDGYERVGGDGDVGFLPGLGEQEGVTGALVSRG